MEETELNEGTSAQEDAGPESVPEETEEGPGGGEEKSDEKRAVSGKPVRKEEVGTVQFKEIQKGDT
ncbi:MAG: hypothetical protein E4H15_08210, partial [Syntrophobacterales bacterium]